MFKRLAHLLQDTQLSLFGPEPVAAPPVVVLPVATPRPDEGLSSAGLRRELSLGAQRVTYQLKRARRRSIGFVVGPEGLRVSAPRWVTQADIDQALRQKSDWILRKLLEQRERASQAQATRMVWADGAKLAYLGTQVQLNLTPAQPGVRWLETEQVLAIGLPLSADEAQIRAAAQAWLQRRARAVFEPRCQHFAAALGVQMTQLRLSSARTRWGSASANGTIRLNWRLIHFTPAVIDYVVAHELAHLREMNHSPRFWAVVRSVLPEFEQARAILARESIQML
ncbi:M48 family metallopeptidase [Roseateles sp. GG27B]